MMRGVSRLHDFRNTRTLETLEAAPADKAQLLAGAAGVAELERMRLARELHDGPIQQMTTLAFAIDLLVKRLDDGDVEGAREEAQLARTDLRDAMVSLRTLMGELRPT
jgi:signal transduction histidine kinase